MDLDQSLLVSMKSSLELGEAVPPVPHPLLVCSAPHAVFAPNPPGCLFKLNRGEWLHWDFCWPPSPADPISIRSPQHSWPPKPGCVSSQLAIVLIGFEYEKHDSVQVQTLAKSAGCEKVLDFFSLS